MHLTMRWAQPPANDDFAGAVDLGTKKLPIDVLGTNVDATLEPSEEATSYWTGSTVWYRWTATSTRLVTVETCGSTVDTDLAVVQGTALDALDVVADNEDGCGGQQSRAMFSAAAGETYLFQVGAVFGKEGDIRLGLRDDDIADAQVLDGGTPIT